MYNYKMEISYDGSNHNGWQSQGNTKNTVQNVIENCIQEVTGQKVEVIASGRTDKGVHAYGQVANFKISEKINKGEFLTNINKALPTSIAILSITDASDRFHSRLNVTSKTYVYKILNRRIYDPLRRNHVYFVNEQLNMKLLEEAMEKLVGENDYLGFSSLKKSKKSTVRKITEAKVVIHNDEIHLVFKGNGFLYNQVRIMAGTAVDIALKNIPMENIDIVFKSKKRELAGMTLPPMGLYLEEVIY